MRGRGGLFGFRLPPTPRLRWTGRFGSVTGFLEPAPSPKPRQKSEPDGQKNPRPKWLQHFFKRSRPQKCAELPSLSHRSGLKPALLRQTAISVKILVSPRSLSTRPKEVFPSGASDSRSAASLPLPEASIHT